MDGRVGVRGEGMMDKGRQERTYQQLSPYQPWPKKNYDTFLFFLFISPISLGRAWKREVAVYSFPL